MKKKEFHETAIVHNAFHQSIISVSFHSSQFTDYQEPIQAVCVLTRDMAAEPFREAQNYRF
jgi:hypothetical protein